MGFGFFLLEVVLVGWLGVQDVVLVVFLVFGVWCLVYLMIGCYCLRFFLMWFFVMFYSVRLCVVICMQFCVLCMQLSIGRLSFLMNWCNWLDECVCVLICILMILILMLFLCMVFLLVRCFRNCWVVRILNIDGCSGMIILLVSCSVMLSCVLCRLVGVLIIVYLRLCGGFDGVFGLRFYVLIVGNLVGCRLSYVCVDCCWFRLVSVIYVFCVVKQLVRLVDSVFFFMLFFGFVIMMIVMNFFEKVVWCWLYDRCCLIVDIGSDDIGKWGVIGIGYVELGCWCLFLFLLCVLDCGFVCVDCECVVVQQGLYGQCDGLECWIFLVVVW